MSQYLSVTGVTVTFSTKTVYKRFFQVENGNLYCKEEANSMLLPNS